MVLSGTVLRHAYHPAAAWVKRNVLAPLLADVTAGSSNAILMYHSVGAEGFWGNVDVNQFVAHLDLLAETVELVDLPEAVADDSDRRKVALTFDDGFQNFYTHAFPLICEREIPVTVFVNPGFLNDRNREEILDVHELKCDGEIVMRESQLRELAASPLITIGNHTTRHQHLTSCTTPERRAAIGGGKKELEILLDTEIDRFCYPYGEYDRETVALVRDGHNLATTAGHGLLDQDATVIDPYRLPRIPGHVPTRLLAYYLTE